MTPLQRLKLADGFNLLGDSNKAAQLYLEVLKQPPDLPLIEERVRANLADIYLRGSDHKRASNSSRRSCAMTRPTRRPTITWAAWRSRTRSRPKPPTISARPSC